MGNLLEDGESGAKTGGPDRATTITLESDEAETIEFEELPVDDYDGYSLASHPASVEATVHNEGGDREADVLLASTTERSTHDGATGEVARWEGPDD